MEQTPACGRIRNISISRAGPTAIEGRSVRCHEFREPRKARLRRLEHQTLLGANAELRPGQAGSVTPTRSLVNRLYGPELDGGSPTERIGDLGDRVDEGNELVEFLR